MAAMAVAVILAACDGANPESGSGFAGKEMAAKLNAEFARCSAEAARLAEITAGLYRDAERHAAGADRSKYSFHGETGAFYKHTNDGGAALWVSGVVPITPEVMKVAYFTEPLDAHLKEVCRQLPCVSQAYYNDRHSLNRIYPWFDTVAQYPARMDIPKYNFYYLADETHNPSRGPTWVREPYLDPAGRGWMVSTMAPVYHGDKLEGVLGLDITVNDIVSALLVPEEEMLFLVSPAGIVVARNPRVRSLLGLPPLTDPRYLGPVEQDTFKPDEQNILLSQVVEVRQLAHSLLVAGQEKSRLEAPEGTFWVESWPIPELQWKLVRLSK